MLNVDLTRRIAGVIRDRIQDDPKVRADALAAAVVAELAKLAADEAVVGRAVEALDDPWGEQHFPSERARIVRTVIRSLTEA